METEKANLSEVLGETEPNAETTAPSEPEKGETANTETVEAKEEAETEKVADKGEPPSSDETKKDADPNAGILAALKEERKKRQAIEQEVAQLKNKETQAAKPDQFEDPEGYEKWKDEQQQNALWNQKCELSEAIARQQYGDEEYDRAYEAFLEEANSNPAVAQGVATAKSPAHYAYEQGMKAIKRAELGDPETFAERKFKEGYEQAKAEFDKTLDEKLKAALADILPTSLAREQSQGDRASGPAWDGPKPLDQLIGD